MGQSHSPASKEVIMTSQVGHFHLGTSCDVFATSQVRQSHLGNSWYVAMTSQIGWFYLGVSETSWQRPKKSDSLTYQWRRRDDVSMWSATSQPKWDQNETSLRRRMPSGKQSFTCILRKVFSIKLFSSLIPFFLFDLLISFSRTSTTSRVRTFLIHG